MSLEQKLEQDFGTIPDLVRYHAEEAPDRIVLVDEARQVTYREFDVLCDRIATTLQCAHIAPQSAIAACASSSIEYAALFLGALRAGIAVSPLAPSSTPESLAVMVADCGSPLLFFDASTEPVLREVDAKVTRVTLDGSAGGKPFAEWLMPESAKPKPVQIEPSWPFNIIYSSGTTGVPKGIVQSHGMRWQHVRRANLFGYGPDAVSIISTPLYSNTTLVSFFPTLALGGTAVLMSKFDASKFIDLAEKHRATHAMLVPVQYSRIMTLPDFGKHDLSSFRMKFSTSAPFNAVLKSDILKRWPGGLVEYYGMTEGGGTCILAAHEFPDKLHTVGRPSEGHDIRLIDENGREVAAGEVGEVVGHSAGMMNGYHNQPSKTAEAEWRDKTGKRFIRTGDVGRFDADGFLQLMDRRKDMIISGGFNIYPSDLEAVIASHPDVAEASVIGVPSEAWGETPVAYVVFRAGSNISAEALREWTNSRLGKTQRVNAVEVVDALPRSAIGKVLKRELRDEWIANGRRA
ncbi:MAG: acyl--CoA ligase [Methylobacteriaceae bacterium]|nr:acyl--CoA ligase [Methylobacteriaceae bacterium]